MRRTHTSSIFLPIINSLFKTFLSNLNVKTCMLLTHMYVTNKTKFIPFVLYASLFHSIINSMYLPGFGVPNIFVFFNVYSTLFCFKSILKYGLFKERGIGIWLSARCSWTVEHLLCFLKKDNDKKIYLMQTLPEQIQSNENYEINNLIGSFLLFVLFFRMSFRKSPKQNYVNWVIVFIKNSLRETWKGGGCHRRSRVRL